MGLGHNVFIRSMNGIYRQAPHIKLEDHCDFVNYAKCWADVLEAHHTMEETSLFPQIEVKTGEVGIMEVNVEQHRETYLTP